jgi:glutaconate CoA-transferase subunit A
MAAPAIWPDVTVLHAETADREGNVLGPVHADFLFDLDANLARASRRVIVTVERLADRDEIVAGSRRAMLFGFEVNAVVVLPGGARPSALPGAYSADLGALTRYLAAAGADGAGAAAAIGELV